jgi:atlastin
MMDTGYPVQIFENKEHKFILYEEKLQKILNHQNAHDKKVCIVSVAGDLRKGKSFLLNFFLRYLSQGGREDWMGSEDKPLTGFDWKRGDDKVTNGIWIWSEPFIIKNKETGKEVNKPNHCVNT